MEEMTIDIKEKFDFGRATKELSAGRKVCRQIWNNGEYLVLKGDLCPVFYRRDDCINEKQRGVKWVALTDEDILAKDWMLAE